MPSCTRNSWARTLAGDLGLRALLLLLLGRVRRRLLLLSHRHMIGMMVSSPKKPAESKTKRWCYLICVMNKHARVPLASSDGKTGGQPYVSNSALSLLAAA